MEQQCSNIEVCKGSISNKWYEGIGEYFNHNIDHSYSFKFSSFDVPILKTKRTFSCHYKKDGKPRYPEDSVIDGATGWAVPCDDTYDSFDRWESSISEDCIIERSTLCYLDQANAVCLYRYEKEECSFAKSSDEWTAWRAAYIVYTGKIIIYKNDITSKRTVEWRLIKGSEQQTITKSIDTEWHPFGESFSLPLPWGLSGNTNPDIRQIICLPQPPSQSTSMDPVIKALEGAPNGLYDYMTYPGEESEMQKLDGGRDFFYPRWCRGMIADPIWREIADNRYAIYWYKSSIVDRDDWIPEPIYTDYMPNGNYVKHFRLGEMYQWLIDGSIIVESMDILDLVNKELPDNLKITTGKLLNYPFGVV